MNRFPVIALVIGILSGCGSSGPAASPSPAATAGATATAASVQPSVTPTLAPTLAPTVAVTEGPTPTPTLSPTPFPTEAFANLSDDLVPDDVAAKFQAILAGMTAGRAIAATVMTPDGTWSGASGTADGIRDLEVNSQFGIASGTKPIIAAQVMQLVEAGEVPLDTPATEYLPPDFTFDTNGATIRQLLSHRSGIPDWYTDDMKELVAADRTRVWELSELFALVGAARRPVGVRHEYADTNYNLLGLVIEHVRQRPLLEVLRQGVLRVEGTERLIYQPDEAPTDPMAMPLGESRDALEQGGGYLPSISDASSCGPACAIASDSISLARWWRAFCAGDIVSEASLAEMSTFYDGADGYGLGLFNPVQRASVKAVGHLGANFGYNSSAGCLTEDHVVFVVLTNQALDVFDLATPLVRAALSD